MNKYRILLLCAMLLLLFSVTDLFAQGALELERVIPGAPARGIFVPNDSSKMDFNGDGVPDMPLLEEEGISYYLKIIDGADPENAWSFQIGVPDTNVPTEDLSVMGFCELDGSNTTMEIVLAEKQGRRFVNPIVIDSNGQVLWDGSGKFIHRCNPDMKIVASDPTVRQIEIWREKKG